jgi:hypothetical protein
MAKRRRSKKPNLPQSTLERARRQAGGEETPDAVEESPSEDAPEEEPAKSSSPAESSSRRRKVSPVQLERSRQRGELTHEMIEDILHNPTIEVPQEQLREDYQHVLLDLRNMGVLAAALFVVLVLLAQFI